MFNVAIVAALAMVCQGMTIQQGPGGLAGIIGTFLNSVNIMPGSTETPNSFIMWDPENPGSGPYAAKAFSDDSLPKHTIYAPTAVTDKKLPVILWGNGGCLAVGTMFSGFLKEIASHGYLVIANGKRFELPSIPVGGLKGDYKHNVLGSLLNSASADATSALPAFLGSGFTRSSWQIESADWAAKGAAGGKFGIPDMDKLAVAGQSCGGVEAYAVTTVDPRIKATVLFNSGTLFGGREKLKDFKHPVGIFNGGPVDLAYINGEGDFNAFAPTLPVVKANIDSGHLGTYFAPNGGKYGKIAVAFFDAVLKNDEQAKKSLFPDGPFKQDGWNISTRNW